MIVASWHKLLRAIDDAVPCYAPVDRPPNGDQGRCGQCDGCKDHEKVEEVLADVENEVEQGFLEREE